MPNVFKDIGNMPYWSVAKPNPKRPSDPMQLAKQVGDIATGLAPDPLAVSEELRRYMTELGRRGGLEGGPARRKALSKKRRVEIAKKAARTRWKRPKG